MANYLDQIEVNTAITDNTKLDLGHVHITTANFMQMNPVLCKEMVPGEKADCSLMTFSRMQPLAVPTFGRAVIKERAFFVPFRTIFRGWNDFITDTPHVFSAGDKTYGIIPSVPTVSNNVFVQLFNGVTVFPGGGFITTEGLPGDYDLKIVNAQGNPRWLKLTDLGRQALKVLESLGYKIVWDMRNTDVYSALPLLALAKIYMDWYFPSAYAGTVDYSYIYSLLNQDISTGLQLNYENVAVLLGWTMYVNFDSDYLVSAWDNPVAPNSGVYSDFHIVDITTLGSGMNEGQYAVPGSYPVFSGYSAFNFGVDNGLSSNGTPVTSMSYKGTVASSPIYDNNVGLSVSEYQHSALKKLTDYMKRHQLVGARAMDRYLARFGKALPAEKLNRCNYIATKMVPLSIGDVMSTADTSGDGTSSNLGTFAGKGIAYEQGFEFDWSTDEYGYLMVISTIVPASGVYQGVDRKVMHTTKLSFWTPEFDSLGVQAISMREVYNNYDGSTISGADNDYMSFDKTVFGFAPRYGEYKYANDQLTGDFVVRSLNNNDASNSAWHLMRTFDDGDFSHLVNPDDPDSGVAYDYSQLGHSLNFIRGYIDHAQFNRIFTYSGDAIDRIPDPFTMIYDFNLVSYAPMKSLYDNYDFEDKGRKVKEEANGVKMN